MSADNKKQELRSLLAGKNTDELEELLALEATEFDAAGPNADYIATILEVIAERESKETNDTEMTEKAWEEFQAYYSLRKQEELETDSEEESPSDHPRKTEYGQRSPKMSRMIRYGIIAAVLAMLLCGTALGWNFFRAVADWTEETFRFLTGQEKEAPENQSALNLLQLSVKRKTDIAAVPKWAPAGTERTGLPQETGRTDRFVVLGAYTVDNREFTIRIIIHDTPPETYDVTYQKNTTIEKEYLVGGVIHYIMGNTETLSAMWLNGCVEGYIQGELTIDEMQQMIDSIYEE